jgi:hypothetical protein
MVYILYLPAKVVNFMHLYKISYDFFIHIIIYDSRHCVLLAFFLNNLFFLANCLRILVFFLTFATDIRYS